MNTPSNPVPVTGSLGITGTANVNITNPTVPVSGNVSLTGTPNVNVSNTPNVNITNNSIPVTLQSKVTKLFYGHKFENSAGELDTSPCSILRFDAINFDANTLKIYIYDSNLVDGGFLIMENGLAPQQHIQFTMEAPPPSLLVEAQDSKDYWLNVWCR